MTKYELPLLSNTRHGTTAPQLFRFPQGESLQDWVARAADALRGVLQRHRDQTVVLVSHDSVNRALLTQVLDQPLSAHSRIVVEPRGITEIEFVGDIERVLRVNETQHLDAIQTATEKKKTEIPVPTQNCELSRKLEDFPV